MHSCCNINIGFSHCPTFSSLILVEECWTSIFEECNNLNFVQYIHSGLYLLVVEHTENNVESMYITSNTTTKELLLSSENNNNVYYEAWSTIILYSPRTNFSYRIALFSLSSDVLVIIMNVWVRFVFANGTLYTIQNHEETAYEIRRESEKKRKRNKARIFKVLK